MKKMTALLLCTALAAASLSGCSRAPEHPAPTAAPVSAASAESEEVWGRTVKRDGHTWRYNSRLTTVLFMGVDTYSDAEEDPGSFGSGGRADTIGLLIMNPDTRTTSVVMISRDTMAEVSVYSPEQIYMYSTNIQLAMQYTVGDSHSRSCQLMKRAVSNLLLDLPISATCSMTLDGITAIVDFMGGITLTLDEDWTDIDPSYTAGSTIIMSAVEVNRFLRYRDIDTLGSNDVRMERQGWFIRQMFTQMSKLSSGNVETLLQLLDPFLQTDMDAESIKALSSYHFDNTIYHLPGQTVLGDGGLHDEFHVDEAAMQDLLLKLFYFQTA